MAWRESGGLLCLGLFLVASSFCHCMRLTDLKALDKLRGNSTLSHGQAKASELRHGRLLIGQSSVQGAKLKGTKATKNLLDVGMDYQADMDWGQPKQPKGQSNGHSRLQPDDATVERLLKMEPKVECTGGSMKLQVQDAASTPGSLFFVDRGSRLSPLPLSKLPQSCGYTIRSTRTDLFLVAPYDGCFVALEEDSYVLPLRWLGLPVKMSCPLMRQSSPSPPMVTCHTEGMVVKMEWTVSVATIKVNLNGNWEPLMKASSRCGFSVVVHPEGVVVSVRYAPCLEKKDGMYTLELSGDGETKISCPLLSPAKPEPTKSPANGAEPRTKLPSVPEGQVPQPYIPLPFYPWPTKPEEPPVRPQATQQPNGQEKHPYPFYVKPPNPDSVPFAPRPELKPLLSTVPPVVTMYQRRQPFYSLPVYPPLPKPETPTTEPPVTKPPLGKHFLPTPFNHPSQPPQIPVEPSVSQPEGQQHTALYPLPFYPWPPQPPASQPTTKPPQPEAPQGQVYNPYYTNPFYLQPEPGTQPTTKPPQPEAPQGQVYNPYYPNPFYLQPEPGTQPTTKPPQPEAPQGQVYNPYYPNPFYPQPAPENLPTEKPVVVPKPPVTEMPKGQVTQLPYPQPHTEKPVKSEQPPTLKPPEGQVPYHFNTYYPQQPQRPQPITLPPATFMQQPQQVTIPASGQKAPESAFPQPSKGDIVPQDPQLGSTYSPPVYCPQFCPSGFSNCCLQIAFHQHLHHIVPAGPGSKDAPLLYPGLPFLPSVAYSGFGNGFGSSSILQKPTEAATASISAPISPQSLPSGNEKQPYLQPPDGNPAALPGSNPSKPTYLEQQIYPYVPNLLYPNWPYQPQNEELQILPQRHSPAHYGVPSKTQAPGNEPINPMVQYWPYNVQLPNQQNYQLSGPMNNPSGPNFMPLISQNLQQQHTAKQQNKRMAKELQPTKTNSSDSKGPVHPKVQSELDRLLVPYYMAQDAHAPTYSALSVSNNSTQPQPFVGSSKKSARHEQSVNAYSEPMSYVLLQRSPPGRETNSPSESLLPFRDLVHDANFLAQSLARHQGSKLQRPQEKEKPQYPKWLDKGMSNPLPSNVNYMPRPGDESESSPLLFSPSDGRFVSLPQDPSLTAAHSKPKFSDSFKDFWKTMKPLGSSQKIPPHVPGEPFNDGALQLTTKQMD